MKTPIILIGPMFSGKSTIAGLLANQLKLPRYCIDDYRWDYYSEIGYDDTRKQRIQAEEGLLGVIRYWKPFEAYAVERILSEHIDGIIDFGGGHSVYDDDTLFERVAQALAPHPNVILLMPSSDIETSLAVLQKRMVEEKADHPDMIRLNEHFTRHPSNTKLAKHIVYTQGKTPDETCADVLSVLS